ncbi:hypothetical protein FQN60_015748, partial [Etheostoma spectabile]
MQGRQPDGRGEARWRGKGGRTCAEVVEEAEGGEKEYMVYRKHTYMRLDGSSKISERRDMVADFQS